MFRPLACLLSAVWLLSTAGCEQASEQVSLGSSNPAGDRAQESATAGHEAPQHGDHSHADVQPLPLLPIMMQMQGHLAGLMQALWLESYADMATHARGVAAHAPISAEELARIEAELGPEMAAFEAADEAVHEASLRMLEAAEAEDMEAFLEQLATVQRGCVGCHSEFRERLRTNAPAGE